KDITENQAKRVLILERCLMEDYMEYIMVSDAFCGDRTSHKSKYSSHSAQSKFHYEFDRLFTCL
ncbi:MAG: hypothetical protein OXI86_14485, partial [Candidatus Poribacteria bacterium]|nr:hypothetical protein [Candidatus Poribacteria bacterium]